MGYSTETFTGYAVNLGDAGDYGNGDVFASGGAFYGKEADDVIEVVESDYPLLSAEIAGDTTVESIVIVAVASSVRLVEDGVIPPEADNGEDESIARTQLGSFVSRFGVTAKPRHIIWSVRS